MQPEQVLILEIMVHRHICMQPPLMEKEDMNLKENKEGTWECLEGDREWRNDVTVVLQSQKQKKKWGCGFGAEDVARVFA